MDLKGLPRLSFDPFSIDVSDILFEKRGVVQLRGSVSECKGDYRTALVKRRTGGMLWFGAIAYVLATILGRVEV